MRPQHAHHHPEVVPRLRLALRRVVGCRLVDPGVRDAVSLHELLAHCPELRRVHGPGRPVALVVVLPVAAPLAGLEPGDRWDAIRVLAARGLQHGQRHGLPFGALLGAGHPPVVCVEPALRRPGHDLVDRHVVDPVVVPVEQEHEVREPQPPRRVARLVARARGQPALALDDEDLDLLAAGELEGDRLARGGRHAVPRRPGVELDE